jgi:hypothetical protein
VATFVASEETTKTALVRSAHAWLTLSLADSLDSTDVRLGDVARKCPVYRTGITHRAKVGLVLLCAHFGVRDQVERFEASNELAEIEKCLR